MIIANRDTQTLTKEGSGILNYMDTVYRQSLTANQSYWIEASLNNRFWAGDQTVWNEVYNFLPIYQRSTLSFNHIRPIINMVSGYQRQHRKSIVVTPRENSDQETADQFSKLMMWAVSKDNMLETISEAFQGALISGLNLMELTVDYRTDPVNGDIKLSNCAWNTFIIDPYFTKMDLSDCQFIWKRSYVTKRDMISLIPDKEEEILQLNANFTSSARDPKFPFTPQAQQFRYQNLLPYDEFYYRDYRTQEILVDSQTGETVEWKSEDKEQLELFLQTYPTIQLVKQQVPTVNLAIVSNDIVLYHGPNPLGLDEYNFVPVWCFYNPHLPNFNQRIQSMVTDLRDPSYCYSRRKLIELQNMESIINSGVKFKQGALVNPEEALMAGAGKPLVIAPGFQLTDVEMIQQPILPPTTLQLSESLLREIHDISGVNQELMGSAVDDKAGILAMLRQGAGLTTLQGVFDNLDYSIKMLGNKILQLMQMNFTPGKVQRVIEQQPTPVFYHKAWGIFDAVIEEGLYSSTQRQMQFAQMLQLREVGVPISSEDLLQAATMQNKTEIVERAKQQEQMQMQQQQAQMQAQQQLQQEQAKLADARSMYEYAGALERASRIDENRGLAIERVAEAEKDREMAVLNRAKALKELASMDLESISKMLEIANMLKSDQDAEKEKNSTKDVASSLRNFAMMRPNETESNLAQRLQFYS